MQRISLRFRAPEPFCRFKPGWMTQTIIITKSRDGLRENFDTARRRDQWMRQWIAAKILEQDERMCDGRELKETLGPECIEIRPGYFPASRLLSRRIIQMPQEFHLRAPFGKGVALPELLSQISEDGKIVARVADWRDSLLHRHE